MHAHEPCNSTNLFVFDHPTTFFSSPRGNQRLPSDQRSKNAVPCDVFRLPKPCHGREFNGDYMGAQPSFSCPPTERLQSADNRDSANKDPCTAWISRDTLYKDPCTRGKHHFVLPLSLTILPAVVHYTVLLHSSETQPSAISYVR